MRWGWNKEMKHIEKERYEARIDALLKRIDQYAEMNKFLEKRVDYLEMSLGQAESSYPSTLFTLMQENKRLKEQAIKIGESWSRQLADEIQRRKAIKNEYTELAQKHSSLETKLEEAKKNQADPFVIKTMLEYQGKIKSLESDLSAARAECQSKHLPGLVDGALAEQAKLDAAKETILTENAITKLIEDFEYAVQSLMKDHMSAMELLAEKFNER